MDAEKKVSISKTQENLFSNPNETKFPKLTMNLEEKEI